MTIQLKAGHRTEDPRLDRIPHHDERNADYPIRALLNPAAPLRSYTWTCNSHLDQMADGACVGFGFGHELVARPRVVAGVTASYCKQELYWNIQRKDPWPGGAYPGADPFYEGTDVLTGAQYLTDQGWYDQYRWADTEEDLARAIGYHGPGVLGVQWQADMMDVDKDGFVHFSGGVVGGHCILVKAINLRYGAYLLHQSWGESWGVAGDCWVSRTDMAKMISRENDGEACIPVVRMPRMSV